jgi:translation initiation factor 1
MVMGNRTVYREFGNDPDPLERGIPDRPPAQQDLRIQVSRKGRGGKTVSIISGFQHKAETLDALLKQLKNQCGAGGVAKDNQIEIQGDHRQKLLQVLTEKGYKAKLSGG